MKSKAGSASEAVLRGRGQERAVTVMRIRAARNREKAITAPVGGAARIVSLRTLEEREHVVVAPARVAEVAPAVEASPVTADMRHGVDGARTAVDLAARAEQHPALQAGLGLGAIAPVVGGSHQRYPTPRGGDIGVALSGDARLQEQDTDRGIGGQTMGEHAARGAGAHHDVVERPVRAPSGVAAWARGGTAASLRKSRRFIEHASCQTPPDPGEAGRSGRRRQEVEQYRSRRPERSGRSPGRVPVPQGRPTIVRR